MNCKVTYRDVLTRFDPKMNAIGRHHWVHRWKLEGRCNECRKSFQQKIFRERVSNLFFYIIFYIYKLF